MFKQLCIALFAAASVLLSAHATIVRPLSLDEMTASAATIFQGKCVANKTVREPNSKLIVTYTTFAITDAIKGSPGTTLTIKQFGGTLPEEGARMSIEGVPTFTPGEDYLVFLNGVSSLGFSSPTGLSQGRFSIEATAEGVRTSNGRDFREMTARLPARHLSKTLRTTPSQRVTHLHLDELKGMVRSLSAVQP